MDSHPTARKGEPWEPCLREIVRVLRVFEDVFSERVWDWVQVLVVGRDPDAGPADGGGGAAGDGAER